MLQPIIDLLLQALHYITTITGNYGWSIVVMTVLIRLAILPLFRTQMQSMRAMQAIQPEMEKIQKKYKDKPEKLNEETMKLWQEHGVNPMGGCLPMLIQLPVLWAFFRALMDNPELQEESFYWIANIGAPDPYYILPVLAAVATFGQTQFTTRMQPSMGNQQQGMASMQQMMMYGMPLFIGWLSARYPAGLALYWVVSAGIGGLQQFLIPRGSEEEGAA